MQEISSELFAEIIKLHLKGCKNNHIATILGVTVELVTWALNRHNYEQ